MADTCKGISKRNTPNLYLVLTPRKETFQTEFVSRRSEVCQASGHLLFPSHHQKQFDGLRLKAPRAVSVTVHTDTILLEMLSGYIVPVILKEGDPE